MSRINDLFLKNCSMEYKVVLVTEKNQIRFLPFLNEREMSNIDEGYYVFGAESYENGVGIIVFHMNEYDADLLRVKVKEEYRRTGVGAFLMTEMKHFVGLHGIDRIYTRFCLDQLAAEEYSAYLSDCGFYRSDEKTELMIFKIADMKASALYRKFETVKNQNGDILRLDEIPISYFNALKARLGSQLPDELLPSHTLGKMELALSYGYLQNGKLKAFLIFSRLNGRLYLNSAYTDSGANIHFMNMLSSVLVKIGEEYSDFSEISVYLINDNARKLAANLTKEFADRVEIQSVEAFMWDKKQELGDYYARRDSWQTMSLTGGEPVYSILAPKLMRLSDILEEAGVEAIMIGLELPALFVQYPEYFILIRYVPLDVDAGKFMITFSAPIPDGKNNAEFEKNLRYSRMAVEGNDAVLRMCLNEGLKPIDSDDFRAAFEAFRSEADIIIPMNEFRFDFE